MSTDQELYLTGAEAYSTVAPYGKHPGHYRLIRPMVSSSGAVLVPEGAIDDGFLEAARALEASSHQVVPFRFHIVREREVHVDRSPYLTSVRDQVGQAIDSLIDKDEEGLLARHADLVREVLQVSFNDVTLNYLDYRRQTDQSAYSHALYCAMYSALIARRMGLEEKRLHDGIVYALMHEEPHLRNPRENADEIKQWMEGAFDDVDEWYEFLLRSPHRNGWSSLTGRAFIPFGAMFSVAHYWDELSTSNMHLGLMNKVNNLLNTVQEDPEVIPAAFAHLAGLRQAVPHEVPSVLRPTLTLYAKCRASFLDADLWPEMLKPYASSTLRAVKESDLNKTYVHAKQTGMRLAQVLHDINQPLTVIASFIDLYKGDAEIGIQAAAQLIQRQRVEYVDLVRKRWGMHDGKNQTDPKAEESVIKKAFDRADLVAEIVPKLEKIATDASLICPRLVPNDEEERKEMEEVLEGTLEQIARVRALCATLNNLFGFKLEKINLLDLVQRIVRGTSTNGVRVRTTMEEWASHVQFDGDLEKLLNAGINITNNAAEACNGSGQVQVWGTYNQREGRVEVHVKDNGPGMSPEEVTKAVEPFFTTKDEGTGLGMGIAISCFNDHKGGYEINSTKGHGLHFIGWLPQYMESTIGSHVVGGK